MNKRGTLTYIKKEASRFTVVWTQTLLSPVVSNLLFLFVFGAMFAQRPSPVDGVPYLAFLIPGLAAMGLLTNAFSNSSSSLVQAKYMGDITSILMLPLSGWELLIANVVPAVMRGALVAAATVGTGLLFTSIPFTHPWLILLATLLLGTLFGALGIVVGIWSTTFDQMTIISSFVLQPLTYLGGVFYSVSLLPGVFGQLSRFNPLLYMIDLFRYGFLGFGDTPLVLSLAVSAGSTVVALLVAWWMFATGYKLKS